MYTIQHNPARPYNCDETGITIVQHKHTKILRLKGKRQISSLQSAERGSLVTVVKRMSPAGQFIPPLLVFPRKYMKPELMNGTPPGSIHACHFSGWTQSRFSTSGFFIPSNIQSRWKRSCYLGTGRALSTHKGPGGLYFSSRESCWHNLPPTSQQSQNVPLDKAFMEPLKTFYSQETEI